MDAGGRATHGAVAEDRYRLDRGNRRKIALKYRIVVSSGAQFGLAPRRSAGLQRFDDLTILDGIAEKGVNSSCTRGVRFIYSAPSLTMVADERSTDNMSEAHNDLKPTIDLPNGYRPSDKEDFMNPKQVEYFRRRLLQWRDDILKDSNQTLQNLQEGSVQEPDISDRASTETDRALELRTRDRQRKLIGKIDAALRRIAEGSYGFCEETGEPIGLRRLEALPIATLSIESQERHERREKTYRDD